ncbi:MAG: class II aldolase/adducin family protein [Anaerolineales bacterium]|nr:class II aldolase/adducin family protein [Anaerolineales bacterium]
MKFLDKYATEVEIFVNVCHRLAHNLYVTSSGGNLAWKLEDNLLLITPTLLNKGDISLEDLVFIDLHGKVVEGKHRPTGETPMYLKFFDVRKDIISVIHCHAPNVGALAIMKGKNWLMCPVYPETTIEVGPVPLVPYAEPLTQQLADNFGPFLPKYNNFMMESHGLVSMSRSGIRETLMLVELLEMSAKSILLALQVGEIKELGYQAVKDLGNTMRTRGLSLFGAPGVNKSLEELYFGGSPVFGGKRLKHEGHKGRNRL